MKKNGDKFYAIYSRKSKYTGKGESIDNQIEMCKKYLLNKYGNIEKAVYMAQIRRKILKKILLFFKTKVLPDTTSIVPNFKK